MKSEEIAYKYILRFDKNAILYGGFDSVKSDIYSEIYGWIEVKDLTNGARCGQFTKSTLDKNPFSKILLIDSCEENCKDFVRYHYKNKNVNLFCVVNNKKVNLMTIEDFLNSFSFSLQSYKKRSGSSIPSKKYWNLILENKDNYLKGNRLYTKEDGLKNTYFSISNIEFYINKNLEIRQRGKTKNETWLVEVK